MTRSDRKQKYAILVGDGMADLPIPELGGKTPLQYAKTPAIDQVVRNGQTGLVSTVPEGYPPGSDVANMSLLGYDPAQYYSGRAPIEAASMGVMLDTRDTAFRCNLVTLHEGVMQDYSAGHIDTRDAHALIAELQKAVNTNRMHLYPGVSYRHLLVIRDFPQGKLACTPPHDISGKPWSDHVPNGDGSQLLLELMEKARHVLATASVNQQRLKNGKRPATDIWLWGQGKAVRFPTLAQRYGLTGSVISAVDLVRGLGVLAGLTVRIVPGATGYLDTNYAGKVQAAADALESEDFVYLHIEAPDETSHEGSLEKKLQAIEDFDSKIVAPMLELQAKRSDLRLMVLPDHATPVSIKTHTAGPVPFAVTGAGISPCGRRSYDEMCARDAHRFSGVTLFEEFIRGGFLPNYPT